MGKNIRCQDPYIFEDLVHRYSGDATIEKITNFINEKLTPPFSIAIDSNWGTGKSTFLLNLKNQLKQCGNEVVWFNLWENQNSSNLLLSLLQSIARQLNYTNLNTNTLLYKSLVLHGFSSLGKYISGGLLSYDNVSKIVKDVYQSSAKSYENFKDSTEIIKEEFLELTKSVSDETHKPLVIIFDDFDRCRPNVALELLELIKNILFIKDSNVIFLFGIDLNIIKTYIQNYKLDEFYSENLSEDYLNKIFNLALKLPTNKIESISLFIKDYAEEVVPEEDQDFVIKLLTKLSKTIMINGYRSIINILNIYVSNLYLYPENFDKKEVLVLLFLKEFWPNEIKSIKQIVLNGTYETNLIINKLSEKSSNKIVLQILQNNLNLSKEINNSINLI